MKRSIMLSAFGPDGQQLTGSMVDEPHTGKSLVWAIEHQIDRTYIGPTLGQQIGIQGLGPRRHSMFTVVKYSDSMSPRLLDALVRGHELHGMAIEIFGQSPTEPVYTIALEQVCLLGVVTFTAKPEEVSLQAYPHLERVGLAYRTITWRHENGDEVSDPMPGAH